MSDKTSRIGRLGWIQIDTSDPERLAAFWKVILGVEIEGRLGSPPQFVNLHKQFRTRHMFRSSEYPNQKS